MFDLRLTDEPEGYDEYGRPCYRVGQRKGLRENQDDRLLARALADGYTAAVAETLIVWVVEGVRRHGAGGPVDVLEIGGGGGGLFDRLGRLARTYVNVEPGRMELAPAGLERLRDPRYASIRCSAESIPLPDASCDVVVALASLDHVPDHRRALAEARRLLRPGGILILTLNNRRSWWKALLSRTAYLSRREAEIAQEHHFQWSFDECRDRVSEFLPASEMRTTTFVPFLPRLWRILLPPADVLGAALLRKRGANILGVFAKPGRPGMRAASGDP